jgi:hypothetical protein
MGGIVNGLLIQIINIAKGKLAPCQKHMAITISVCIGIGTNAQKMPINTASDTECRLRCSKLGSCGSERIQPNEGLLSSSLMSGKKRRIVLRGIERSF